MISFHLLAILVAVVLLQDSVEARPPDIILVGTKVPIPDKQAAAKECAQILGGLKIASSELMKLARKRDVGMDKCSCGWTSDGEDFPNCRGKMGGPPSRREHCANVHCLAKCEEDEKSDANTNECVAKCKAGEKWFAPGKFCYRTKPIRTVGGNAGRANCAIPYKYKGKWEKTCVQGRYGRWCPTTDEFDKDGKWGYCADATSCMTDEDKRVHEGDAWAFEGTTFICQKDGKGKKSNCKFPFTYKGVEYKNKCAGTYGLWCYTDKDQKKWEYCS